MIGKTLYQCKRIFRHGISAAYYREIVRPKILRTPSVETIDTSCEIHALTGGEDWLSLIWGLKSFYHFTGSRFHLVVHDDGTLSEDQMSVFETHFRGARIIRRAEADSYVEASFAEHPHIRQFRSNNVMAPKIIDTTAYLNANRMLLVDSDVLFFDRPDVLLSRIQTAGYQKNTFNPDCGSAYNISSEAARSRYGVELLPRMNAGLAVIHKASIDYDFIEELLQDSDIATGHPWRIEQTLYALLSSRFAAELLPAEYEVFLTGALRNRPCRHYVGAVRGKLYSEGIRKLAKCML